jgi:hypothetical protein
VLEKLQPPRSFAAGLRCRRASVPRSRVDAIAAYEKAVALDPQYPEVRLALASVLEKKSKGQSLRPGWCSRQATGPPDSPRGEDTSTAWTAQGEDEGVEWLELNYSRPMRANAVFVYQSLNPGAVVAVTLADEHQQTMATIPVARPSWGPLGPPHVRGSIGSSGSAASHQHDPLPRSLFGSRPPPKTGRAHRRTSPEGLYLRAREPDAA